MRLRIILTNEAVRRTPTENYAYRYNDSELRVLA